MSRRIKIAVGVLLSCLLMVCSGRLWEERRGYEDQVTFASKEQGFDRELLRGLVEPDEEEFNGRSGALSRCTVSAWTEKSDERVEDACSGRKCSSDVMLVYGCTGNLIPYGAQLYPEDKNGCLVSKDVAERLFGTSGAEGQALCYGGKTYRVRGVFREPRELVILEASGMREEIAFNRLTVRVPSGMSPQLAGQQLLTLYGIDGIQIRIDYYDGWHFLSELIPGKWSDFDGWSRNWEGMCDNWQQLSRIQKGALERRHIFLSTTGTYAALAGMVLLTVTVVWAFKTGPDRFVLRRRNRFHPTIRGPWIKVRRSGFFRRFRGSDK